VTAGVRQPGQLVLWDASYAVRLTDDGIIEQQPAGSLPAALTALIGQSARSLPPPSVVHSDLLS